MVDYMKRAIKIAKVTAAISLAGCATGLYWAWAPSGIKPEYHPITNTIPADMSLSGKEIKVTSMRHISTAKNSLAFRCGGGVEAILSDAGNGNLSLNYASNHSADLTYWLMDMSYDTFRAYDKYVRATGHVDVELLKAQRVWSYKDPAMFHIIKRENSCFIKH